MGDINIDLLKNGSSDFTIIFSQQLFCHNYKNQCVSYTFASLIDNIFTNTINSSFISGVLIFDISNNFPVFLRTFINQNEADNGICNSTSNIDQMIATMQYFDWNYIYSIEDVNLAYNNFILVFQRVMKILSHSYISITLSM